MSIQARFCPSTYSALALVMVSMSSCFLNGQTPATPSLAISPIATGGRTASATFMTAPAFALTEAPSAVVATDLNGDGKPDLIVASATTGKVSVYLGKGKGTFAAPIDYNVDGHPSSLIAVDIDGDGTKDIVTANGTDGTVSILLALAGGKLGTSAVYPVGVDANILTTGDLNGDGKEDVVVASQTGKALAVLLNDGQKGLQKSTIQALGKTPTALTVGDFNGDSHLDVVVAGDDGSVDALIGGGDGTLKLFSSLKASASRLSSIVAGEFSATGRLDLAVTEADGRTLTTLRGNADGTFTRGASYRVGSHPSSTVAADVNGDGIPDLISLNQASNTLSVLLGNGDGTFKSTADLTVGDGPVALAAADFQGSGHIGLAVVNASSKNVNVITGKGDGTFNAAPSYTGDLSPRAIASGDLNGDGVPDLVVTNFCGSDAACGKSGSLSVYLGQRSGGYTLASTQAIGSGPVSVALADLNGDGILDVVALNRSDKSLSVLLGVGDGTLQSSTTSSLVGSPVGLIARDLDKDGKLDLAIVSDCGSVRCSQRGSVDTYFGRGDGTFRYGASTPVDYSPSSITAGDLNGDGVIDLVVANACGKDASCNSAGTATVLLGATQGTFSPQPGIALSNNPSSIALRATSGSTTLDLVVSHEADGTVAVLPGNGDGTFKSPALYAVGASPRSLVIADLNGDGRPDIAVANAKDSTVSVLYGQADGTLVAGQSYAVAAGPEALTSVAATSGARANLVTANGNSGSSAPGSEITSLSNISSNATITTTTTLTITPTTGTVNSAFTLQATVNPAPPDGETVTFSSDDVGQLTDCVNPAIMTSGVASCTTSQPTAGSRTLTANYPGDTDYFPSLDNEPQTVTPVAATLALAGPPSAPTVNQSVTYTATLGAGSGSFTPTAPSGIISFIVTGQTGVTCPAVPISGGTTTASCTFTTIAAGSVSVVANYTGDTNFTVTGSSNTVTQTVNPVAASLTVAGPSSNPTVNQSVTYTATLGAGSGSFTPTAPSGTISFTITGQSGVTCPDVVISGGTTTASCAFTTIAAGSVSVVANYTGDTNFTVTGSSNTVTQTVTPVAATLALAGPPSAPTVNQSVTYTATLGAGSGSFTPTAPSGIISFIVTGQTGVTCPAVPISGGTTTASCTFTTIAAGSVSVVANYTGDTNFTVTGSSNTVTQTVNPVAASLTVAGPSSNPTVNQSVTYTATLGAGSGSFTPTAPSGTISFTITGQSGVTCPDVVISGGTTTASCAFTTIAAGSVSVVANYTGDTNFTVTGSSNTVTQTVTPVAATLALAGPPSAPTVNQSVTYTATLGAGSGSFTPTAPSGMVSFTITGQAGATCANITLTGGATTANCVFNVVAAGPVSVVASYAGDNNFTVAGSSNTVTQTVNPIPTALTLSPTSASTVNSPVTFTATLSLTASGTSFMPTAPHGTVAFTANGAAIANCQTQPISGLVATCATSSLTTFADTISAVYTGDTNYVGSTAATITQSVTPIAAATTISTDLTSAVVNQPVTVTATLRGSTSGPVVPTGTVTFSQGTSTLCSTVPLPPASTNATSTAASCVVAFTAVNAGYAVTATYTPSGTNFTAGTPATSSAIPVTAVATTVTLATPAPSPSAVNQSVTFTASVAPAYPASPVPANVVYYPSTSAAVPSGTINFIDQTPTPAAAICTASLATGTSTSCSSSTLARGPHSIQATFVPTGSNFTGSTSSNPVTQTVGASPTMISLASSNPSRTVNQPVTFTATLSATYPGATTPSGTVTYTDGAATAPLCTVTVTNGVVPACTAVFTTAGTHAITATYASDPNFATSNATFNQVVTMAGSGTTVTSSPTSSTVNQTVVFTAVVTASPTGNGLPTGSVTFTDLSSGTVLCNLVPLSGSNATCSYTFTNATTHPVSAAYSGDANFGQSSATVSQMVTATTTTVSISPSPAASVVDQPVTFSITLTSSQPGSTMAKGTVTLIDAFTGASICSQPVAADGSVPSCTTNFLAPGAHKVTATYVSADSNFSTSVSSPATVTVIAATTAVTISSISPGPSLVNQAITFSAVVKPAYNTAGLTLPTGSVVFSTGTTSICIASALKSDGTAMCSALLGSVGTYPVTATYSGDANFTSSATASPVAQTISPAVTSIMVTPAQASVVATNSGTFTAVLTVNTPALAGTGSQGSVPLSGTIIFTAAGGAMVPSTCTASGASIASGTPYKCTVTFPVGAGGPTDITATFTSSTGNFGSSTMTIQQAVKNFTTPIVRAPATPATVYVTQGLNNQSDPFFPSTVGAVVTPAASGFDDSLNYSCPSPASGLTCTPTFASGSNSPTLIIAATTATPPGLYTVTLTATDSTTLALSHSTSFTVQVSAVVASINLTAGATGSLQVPFPAGLTLNPTVGSNYCPNYILNGVLVPTSNKGVGITCTTTSNQTPNGTLSLTVTTTSAISVSAVPHSASRISLAALLGVPLFLLATWKRRGVAFRSNWIRSAGVLSLLVSLSSMIGCGGGFTTTPQTNVATTAGTYQLEVVAADPSGKLYYAIIPLVVN